MWSCDADKILGKGFWMFGGFFEPESADIIPGQPPHQHEQLHTWATHYPTGNEIRETGTGLFDVSIKVE